MDSGTMDQHLPYLRRYARQLTGSQKTGDSYMRAMLEVLMTRTTAPFEPQERIDVYKFFHTVLSESRLPGSRLAEPSAAATLAASPSRQAILLATLDGFNSEEIEKILSTAPASVNHAMQGATCPEALATLRSKKGESGARRLATA